MREFNSHNFTEVLASREGYRILGDDLNSWTQGGCWVLAEAVKKWAGPRCALYCVRGIEHGRYEGGPVPHHIVARVGSYYLDADGIDRGPARVLDTWTRVERLSDCSLETFLPRYRKAALKLDIVCPADAVKRVAAYLEKKFGPGEAATAWMDGEEVRPNPKRAATPLMDIHATRVLDNAVQLSRGMEPVGRAVTILDKSRKKFSLQIFTKETPDSRTAVSWLLFHEITLVGAGTLVINEDTEDYAPDYARVGIAVVAKEFQRTGLYTAVLKKLRKKLDTSIESDVSMTAGAIGAWKKAGGELTDRQGDKVFRINPWADLIPWWT